MFTFEERSVIKYFNSKMHFFRCQSSFIVFISIDVNQVSLQWQTSFIWITMIGFSESFMNYIYILMCLVGYNQVKERKLTTTWTIWRRSNLHNGICMNEFGKKKFFKIILIKILHTIELLVHNIDIRQENSTLNAWT
jgi:hypothetical protein